MSLAPRPPPTRAEADHRPDSDAMNEVAWCYFEGFGTKKDKVSLCVSVLPQPHPATPIRRPTRTFTRRDSLPEWAVLV
jgi:DNA-binding helix-hairpin-helix protein with protein kinase domain